MIAVSIVVLIVRQFLWRAAELHRMLRMPAIIISAGIGYLIVELRGGFNWVAGDWMIIGELALMALTGTVMGSVTKFRTYQDRLQYKLSVTGLWLLFVGIRIGSFYLAALLGTNLASATGLILLSFGVNRLAAILTVRRRARDMLTRAAAGSGTQTAP